MQQYDIRLSLKHDSAANWRLVENTFKPLEGEMIIYSPDESHSYCRVKIGDGSTLLGGLEFIDAGTINGHEVEIVKWPSFAERVSPGSPDKLYVDTSTNIIYHYDNISGYTQLSNFSLNTTELSVSKISSWSAGIQGTATIEDNTLHIINGQAPSLSYNNVLAVKSITAQPTEQ